MDQSINFRPTANMRRSSRIVVNWNQAHTMNQLKDFLQFGTRMSKTAEEGSEISFLSDQSSTIAPVTWRSIFAHLPDILLKMDHFNLPTEHTCLSVIMFIDISGFTSLCETYSNTGKTGTDQLINTLNSYISLLVSEILAYDGDVLKFAGDAILAAWYVESLDTMNSAVIHATECALMVQKKHGDFHTSVGVVLHVKIGISAGEMAIMLLGNDEASCYLELGRSIAAVNKVEDFWKPGDVILSPTAWIHCYQAVTKHKAMEDGKHFKVTEIINRNKIQPYRYCHTLKKQGSEMSLSSLSSSSDSSSVHSGFLGGNVVPQQEGWMRQAFFQELDFSIIEKLKLFIAQPVMKKIEDRQPLEYLSEMRQITIVFINMEIAPITTQHRRNILDQCFQSIHKNAHRVQGLVSKVSLFDKGCTFLVLFGLPGLKHEADCAHALICSDDIRKDLRDREDIPIVSIGVATGPTYCGVVGHMHRHEYTVIGPRVNVAARLMMYFPNKVTCDSETYIHSKLSKENFVNLPPTKVRGMSSYETLKEFKPVIDSAAVATDEDMIVLGRNRELEILQAMLSSVNAMCHKSSINTISVRLKVQDAVIPLRGVSLLLAAIMSLDVKDKSNTSGREKTIRKLVTGAEHKPFLWLFNHILNVNFPVDKAETLSREHAIIDKLSGLISEILKNAVPEKNKLVFLVDDVELLDDQSWQFFSLFGIPSNTLLVSTLRTPITTNNTYALEILEESRALRVQLSGLLPHHITALTCQCLGVSKIPVRLDNVFCKMSMGVPFWVQLMLREYTRKDIIRVIKDVDITYDEKMMSPAPEYLSQLEEEELARQMRHQSSDGRTTLGQSQFTRLSVEVNQTLMQSLRNKIPMICVFSPGAKEEDMGVPESLKGMIQARIGRLDEDAQMIIKAASVLRNQQFLRKMLEWVIRNQINSSYRVGEAFIQLANRGFFTCATLERKIKAEYLIASVKTRGQDKSKDKNKKASMEGPSDVPICVCSGEEADMASCRFLNFPSLFIRDAAYETLTEDYRRQLHMAAAHFLELQVRNCLQVNDVCDRPKLCDNLFVINEDEEEQRPSFHTIIPEKEEKVEKDNDKDIDKKKRKSILMATLPNGESAQERRLSNNRTSLSSNEHPRATAAAPTRHSVSAIGFMGERRGMLAIPVAFGSTAKHVMIDGFDPWTEVSAPGVTANLNNWKSLNSVKILYEELIFHFTRAGSIKMSVIYLLEAAAINCALLKYVDGYNYVKQLHSTITDLKNGLNPFRSFVAQTDGWTYGDLEYAELESLIGITLMACTNNMEVALRHLFRSLEIVKVLRHNASVIELGFKKLKADIVQRLHRRFPNRYMSRADETKSRYLQHSAMCLYYVFRTLTLRRKIGLMAAVCALLMVNRSEKANHCTCTLEVFTSYSCQAQLEFLKGKKKEKSYYGSRAVEMVPEVLENIHAANLMEVSRLYWHYFQYRLRKQTIDSALQIGGLAYAYIKSLEASLTSVHNMPKYSVALKAKGRNKESLEIINALYEPHIEQGFREATLDLISRCWYIYCNLETILSSGIQHEPITKILNYAEKMSNITRVFPQDRLAFYALSCNVCTWYQRQNDQHQLKQWFFKSVFYETKFPTDDLLTEFSYARQLEIKLVAINRIKNSNKALTQRKKYNLRYLERGAKSNVKMIKSLVNNNLAAKPRLFHLLAYYAAINYQSQKANMLLNKAIEVAEQTGNLLEKASAQKSRAYWNQAFEEKQREIDQMKMKKNGKAAPSEEEILTIQPHDETEDDDEPPPEPIPQPIRTRRFTMMPSSMRTLRSQKNQEEDVTVTENKNENSNKNKNENSNSNENENSNENKNENSNENKNENSNENENENSNDNKNENSNESDQKVTKQSRNSNRVRGLHSDHTDSENVNFNAKNPTAKKSKNTVFFRPARKVTLQEDADKPDKEEEEGDHRERDKPPGKLVKKRSSVFGNFSRQAAVNKQSAESIKKDEDVASEDRDSENFPLNLWTKFMKRPEKIFPLWSLVENGKVEIDLLYVLPVGPPYKET